MRIFASDVSELFSRGIGGSEAVRALLCYAVGKTWNMDCPRIEKKSNGKPFFPDHPDKFLSLSHSKSHVLVALSEQDVGADIETIREVRGNAQRLFSPGMLADFGYFGGWTLRESVYKLTGQGSLRGMDIRVEQGKIVTPFEGLCCRVYENQPGCVIAAACREEKFPDEVEFVEQSIFWT